MRCSFLIFPVLFLFLSTLAHAGPGSSGGGNGAGGSPIERFAFDPVDEGKAGSILRTALRTFKEMDPCLGYISQKDYARLSWFKVPAHFEELPNNLTGVPFSSDQYAVQNFKTLEIWISSPAIKRASSLSQAILFMHELILREFFYNKKFNAQTSDELKNSYIAEVEALARRVTRVLIDGRSRKLSRIDYVSQLYNAGATGVVNDFWCSKTVRFEDPHNPVFTAECAEITDISSGKRFEVPTTSPLYRADFYATAPAQIPGEACVDTPHF